MAALCGAFLHVPVDTQPAWYYKDGDALARGARPVSGSLTSSASRQLAEGGCGRDH